MKLKIGIMGTRGIPNHYGGFEQFAASLSVGLVKKGHEVIVYNSCSHPYKQSEWRGVQIIYCKDREKKLGTAGQFFYDLNCIKDSRNRNFDILLHLGYNSDSIWYWLWPKKVLNIVNMDGLEWQRTKYNTLTRRFLRWAEALAAKHADALIADSLPIKQRLLNIYKKEATFIPYGAKNFEHPDPSILTKYGLTPNKYSLIIARMEPENNIEMIIQGYLAQNNSTILFVIGNMTNKYGKYIRDKYNSAFIKFSNAIYDQNELNNLRYHCLIYFHGHSVGGTNPSLLEAMACNCRIAAHNNLFNRSVLQDSADYFTSAKDVLDIINTPKEKFVINQWRKINNQKISNIYNEEKIIIAYEALLLNLYYEKNLISQPAIVNSL